MSRGTEQTEREGVCVFCNLCGVGESAGFIVCYCCLSEGHLDMIYKH